MAEPRARPRAKGQVFNDSDLRELLYAFGDPASHPTPTQSHPPPLPSTISTLDEILTDFIIETCHAAALCASYSRRQKIKMDDFRFVLRRNGAMLGRVNEQMARERWIKSQRKIVEFDELASGKEGVNELEGIAEAGGAENEIKKKGRGRGRRKRKAEDEGEGGKVKKVATS